MSQKIDVVVVAKNSERWLEASCKAILKHIPTNNLIIVVGESIDSTLEIAKRFANILIEDEGKGIGHARALGLRYVKTEFYASVDSDVIISSAWYPCCIETMRRFPFVGAYEGYPKPFGRFYYMLQYLSEEKYCSLGNTLLRTKLIKEVGMSTESYGEDWRLREKIKSRNYKWIVNFDLVSTHLVNDIDIFRHYIYFGRTNEMSLVTLLKGLVLYFKEFTESHNFEINHRIYVLLLRICYLYGSVSGKRIKSLF